MIVAGDGALRISPSRELGTLAQDHRLFSIDRTQLVNSIQVCILSAIDLFLKAYAGWRAEAFFRGIHHVCADLRKAFRLHGVG